MLESDDQSVRTADNDLLIGSFLQGLLDHDV